MGTSWWQLYFDWIFDFPIGSWAHICSAWANWKGSGIFEKGCKNWSSWCPGNRHYCLFFQRVVSCNFEVIWFLDWQVFFTRELKSWYIFRTRTDLYGAQIMGNDIQYNLWSYFYIEMFFGRVAVGELIFGMPFVDGSASRKLLCFYQWVYCLSFHD